MNNLWKILKCLIFKQPLINSTNHDQLIRTQICWAICNFKCANISFFIRTTTVWKANKNITTCWPSQLRGVSSIGVGCAKTWSPANLRIISHYWFQFFSVHFFLGVEMVKWDLLTRWPGKVRWVRYSFLFDCCSCSVNYTMDFAHFDRRRKSDEQ